MRRSAEAPLRARGSWEGIKPELRSWARSGWAEDRRPQLCRFRRPVEDLVSARFFRRREQVSATSIRAGRPKEHAGSACSPGQNRNGSARAPGAVFRALAENTGRGEMSRGSDRLHVQEAGCEARPATPEAGVLPSFGVREKKESGRSCDRPDCRETTRMPKTNSYAARFLRMKRMVLAPNGSSNNAPAIIVVGSGT
jgi:hypothetical protein